MGDLIQLKPCMNIPDTLRAIADEIESGKKSADCVTVIAIPDIYQIGTFNENDAVSETIFACNYAIHKLMNAAMGITS